MKILFAMPWAQRTGGVTHVAASLAASLERRGHRATFLFPSEQGYRLQTGTSPRGFQSIYARLRSYPSKGAPWRTRVSWYTTVFTTLPQLVRDGRARGIDLINVHYPDEGFALLVDLAGKLRAPLVVSAHGSDLLADAGPRRGRGLMRQLDDALAVVVPSKSFETDVLAAYPSLQQKICCIHNGYDADEIAAAGPPTPRVDDITVLCIAALISKKGIDVLLRALQQCTASRLKLRLIGEGPLWGELESLAVDLGLTDRVTFLGPKERPEVFAELQRCDFLAMPSRHPSESFGLAVLEAMAFGKPVVASAVGGLRELVVDGATGLLVPHEDPTRLAHALDALAGDALLRTALGRAGRARAEHFTTAATANSYETLFNDLVTRTRGVTRSS